MQIHPNDNVEVRENGHKYALRDIKKGEKISTENIRVIRPGHGLKPKYFEDVLGKTALKDIERGTPLSFDVIGE